MAEKEEQNKEQSKKTIEMKFCPKCKSENIGTNASISASDYCIDCGFNNSNEGVVLINNFPLKTKETKEKTKEAKE